MNNFNKYFVGKKRTLNFVVVILIDATLSLNVFYITNKVKLKFRFC